jgi:predicted acetylornithine/succinylornithine family transaminase
MSNKAVIAREERVIQNTYARFPIALKRGKGTRVWDEDGKKYLDFMTGIAVNALGHAHPALTKAITAQAGQIAHIGNLFSSEQQVKMAEALTELSGASHVAFANTGAEANELMIKFARRHGHAAGRHEVLAFHGSFHGRTFGALSASGQLKLHKGMEPLLPGFRHVPYGEMEAVKRAVNRYTTAILVEPILGENGVVAAKPEFLVGLRRLADRQGLLLMVDEIQTGLYRTGTPFCFQQMGADFVPDVASVGKSLGGGLPLSAVMIWDKAAKLIGVGEHGTTMGGNAVACAAGLAMLKEIKTKKLDQNVVKMGAALVEGLKAMQPRYPKLLRGVRGQGLMLALDLSQPSKPFAMAALKKGLIVNATADTILRFLPPLNVTPAELKEALAILDSVFSDFEKQRT